MNKIVVVLIVVALPLTALAAYYFWKQNKDVRDLKNLVAKSATNCDHSTDYANCFVDALIKKFGYLRTKAILAGDEQPTAAEQKFQDTQVQNCHCKKGGGGSLPPPSPPPPPPPPPSPPRPTPIPSDEDVYCGTEAEKKGYWELFFGDPVPPDFICQPGVNNKKCCLIGADVTSWPHGYGKLNMIDCPQGYGMKINPAGSDIKRGNGGPLQICVKGEKTTCNDRGSCTNKNDTINVDLLWCNKCRAYKSDRLGTKYPLCQTTR